MSVFWQRSTLVSSSKKSWKERYLLNIYIQVQWKIRFLVRYILKLFMKFGASSSSRQQTVFESKWSTRLTSAWLRSKIGALWFKITLEFKVVKKEMHLFVIRPQRNLKIKTVFQEISL